MTRSGAMQTQLGDGPIGAGDTINATPAWLTDDQNEAMVASMSRQSG